MRSALEMYSANRTTPEHKHEGSYLSPAYLPCQEYLLCCLGVVVVVSRQI